MNIIIALLVLSVIIIIHEFGHFIVAKANGIGVTEFAVGMGPRLFNVKRGETDYCIKLLPFGGSCMMVGEDAESEDEKAFNNKPVWARIAVIAAGPIFNFILAYIMAVIIIANIGYDPCVIGSVEENSVAYNAGLMVGDKIISINGKNVLFAREYSIIELISPDKTLNIVYERDGNRYTTTVVPEFVEKDIYQVGISISELTINSVVEGMPAQLAGLLKDDVIISIDGNKVEDSSAAVAAINNCNGKTIEMVVLRAGNEVSVSITPKIVHTSGYETGLAMSYYRVKTTALQTLGYSFNEVKYWICTVFENLAMMFRGEVSADDVAGPVGVVSLIGDVVEESKEDGIFYVFVNIFNLVLMLSANLGVMNLLPIPALDGGRLVFLIIEAITRKPIDREKEGMVHFVGIILLMILMVIITFNDISNLF